MRDKNFNSYRFCQEVERKLKRYSVNFLRTSVFDSPNFLIKYTGDVVIRTRDLDDLIVLSIASWYLEPEIGILIRLKISEMIRNNFDLSLVSFFLQNKGEMLCYLCDTQNFHTRDFFGNLVTESRFDKLIKLVKLEKRKTSKPSRTIRKRGYKDKGSLKRQHEYHSFASFTFEQNELELKRLTLQNSISFCQGFIT